MFGKLRGRVMLEEEHDTLKENLKGAGQKVMS
jgi:hypothetical protein